jgi:hypothetical protein
MSVGKWVKAARSVSKAVVAVYEAAGVHLVGLKALNRVVDKVSGAARNTTTWNDRVLAAADRTIKGTGIADELNSACQPPHGGTVILRNNDWEHCYFDRVPARTDAPPWDPNPAFDGFSAVCPGVHAVETRLGLKGTAAFRFVLAPGKVAAFRLDRVVGSWLPAEADDASPTLHDYFSRIGQPRMATGAATPAWKTLREIGADFATLVDRLDNRTPVDDLLPDVQRLSRLLVGLPIVDLDETIRIIKAYALKRAHDGNLDIALLVTQMSLALFPNEKRLLAFQEELLAAIASRSGEYQPHIT